jgi:hypothetical protein
MNERIKELEAQCTYQVYDSNQRLYDKFDKEKFAELIIKECANIASCDWHITLPTDTGGTYHPLTVQGGQTAKNIMDHFGVEVNTGKKE